VNTAVEAGAFKGTTVTEILHDGYKREYRIVLDGDEVETEVDSRLTQMQTTANLPGFRKGRVPKEVLRQREGSRIRDEVTARATMAVAEARLKTDGPSIRTPRIQAAEKGDSLTFTLSFEKMPEMPEMDFNSTELTLYKLDPEKNRDALIKFIVRSVNENDCEHVDTAADHEAVHGDLLHISGTRSTGPVREKLVPQQTIVAGEDTCFPESVSTIGMKQGDTMAFEAEGVPAGGGGEGNARERFSYDLKIALITHRPGWGNLSRQIEAMEDEKRQPTLDALHRMGLKRIDEYCEAMLVRQVEDAVIDNCCNFELPTQYRGDYLESVRQYRSEEIKQANERHKRMASEVAEDDLPDSENVTLSDEEISIAEKRMRYQLYELAYVRQHNLLPTREDMESYQEDKSESDQDMETVYLEICTKNFLGHILKRFLIREKFVTLSQFLGQMALAAMDENLDYWNWCPAEDNGDTNEHADSDS